VSWNCWIRRAAASSILDAVPAEATELLDRAAGYLLGSGEVKAAVAPSECA